MLLTKFISSKEMHAYDLKSQAAKALWKSQLFSVYPSSSRFCSSEPMTSNSWSCFSLFTSIFLNQHSQRRALPHPHFWQETFGDVWRHFWLWWWGRGWVLLASSGWRPGVLLNTLHCTRQAPKNKQGKWHEVEKHCSKYVCIMISQFIHFRCKLNFPLCLLFQLFIMWLFFFLVWDPLLIPGILYFTMVCLVLFFIYSAGYFMIPLSLKTHVFQPWGLLFDHFFLLFTLFFLSGSPIRCMMGHQAWSSGLLMFSLLLSFSSTSRFPLLYLPTLTKYLFQLSHFWFLWALSCSLNALFKIASCFCFRDSMCFC